MNLFRRVGRDYLTLTARLPGILVGAKALWAHRLVAGAVRPGLREDVGL